MKEDVTEIWRLYQKNKDYNSGRGLYSDYEKCHRFYSGNQWAGIESGGEELPVLNFIKPIGKYKISTISQTKLCIVYTANGGNDSEKAARATALCEKLNRFAVNQWEKAKMDRLSWKMVKNSFIAGEHYCYCYSEKGAWGTPKLKMRDIPSVNIFLSDEKNPSLNEQEWIIISERVPLSRVIDEGKKNGMTQKQLDQIAADTDDGKCISLLHMRLSPEGLWFSRSVKNAVYSKPQLINGLNVYPLVVMRWEEGHDSARGQSGVKPLIPNQLEVNKTAVRRIVGVKRFSFPTLVYNENKITNVDDITKIGASIAIENMAENPISGIIQYLNPAPISADAQILQSELIGITRSLEGASEAAIGQIDPTKTSGEAIKAARDQSAVILNEQAAAYRQMIEDIAVLWYKLLAAYSPNGIEIEYKSGGETKSDKITAQEAERLDMTIRIDVSPVDPYSKLSQETALERLLAAGYISFEEYVSAIDDSSSVPKAKLEAMLNSRRNGGNSGEMQELRP